MFIFRDYGIPLSACQAKAPEVRRLAAPPNPSNGAASSMTLSWPSFTTTTAIIIRWMVDGFNLIT